MNTQIYFLRITVFVFFVSVCILATITLSVKESGAKQDTINAKELIMILKPHFKKDNLKIIQEMGLVVSKTNKKYIVYFLTNSTKSIGESSCCSSSIEDERYIDVVVIYHFHLDNTNSRVLGKVKEVWGLTDAGYKLLYTENANYAPIYDPRGGNNLRYID